jgi:uncharacterized protein YjiK
MKVLFTVMTTGFLLLGIQALAADTTLAHYSKVDEVIPLPAIGGNLSGITYNSDTKTYFLMQNNYGQIFEYDRGFKKLLRVIKMTNLKDDDTEDIVYLGKGRYALSSEENYILVFSIAPGQTVVDMNTARPDVQLFVLPSPGKDNKGLEGVCFAPNASSANSLSTNRGTFYAVQEQKPKVLYSFAWPNSDADYTSPRTLGVKEPFNTDKLMKHVMSDLAGCTVDSNTGNLLILSHESSRVMELSRAGQVLKTLDIPAVAAQYEGLTIGPDRELVLVSEPNAVVIMKRSH